MAPHVPVGLGLVAVLILAGGLSFFLLNDAGTPAVRAPAPPKLAEQPPEPPAPPDTNPLHL